MTGAGGEDLEEFWREACASGEMAPVDRGLVFRFAGALSGHPPDEVRLVLLLIASLSRARRDGHVRLDLVAAGDHPLLRPWAPSLPSPGTWSRILAALPFVGTGGQGEETPLVLSGGGLYFFSLFRDEQEVAEEVRRRLGEPDRPLAPEERALVRQRSGGDPVLEEVLTGALTRPLFLLTGGPGTGKTYTGSRLLETFKILRPDRSAVVAAPTGKAARRFREALSLPDIEVGTLHRLLGMNDRGFYHGPDRPLPHSLILVDESSMVDLPLMARLFRSLVRESTLVLVGDRDQLSSVGPGSAFGDLAGSLGGLAAVSAPVRRAFHVLAKNHRQSGWSEFDRLVRAIGDGDPEETLALLDRQNAPGSPIRRIDPGEGDFRPVGREIARSFQPLVSASGPEEARERLKAFALLTPFREGPLGSRTLDRLFSRHFAHVFSGGSRFQPAIVVENSYETGLMNGDLGVLKMEGTEAQEAWFPGEEGRLEAFSPGGLPPWEGAFALTVHKAQGSEFDHVHVVLGNDPHPLLVRSLLYTAVTRAKNRLTIYASRTAVAWAVEQPGERATGLSERLSGALGKD